jgi:hypothetical protein
VKRYFLRANATSAEKGPFDLEQLEESRERGRITRGALVRADEPGAKDTTLGAILEELDRAHIEKRAAAAKDDRLRNEAEHQADLEARRSPFAVVHMVGACFSLAAACVLFVVADSVGMRVVAGLVAALGIYRISRFVRAKKR